LESETIESWLSIGMDDRFLATYKDDDFNLGIYGIPESGFLWFKRLDVETVDTPVTAGWVNTGFFWGSTFLDLRAFSQGSRYTRYGDLFG